MIMTDKVISITKCRNCGEDIRLIVTKVGKFMPIQMDDHEPHFHHCGKGNMSAVEWGQQILRNNKTPAVTKPNHKRKLYSGKQPPWNH